MQVIFFSNAVICSSIFQRVYYKHRLTAFPVVKDQKYRDNSQSFVMSCAVARKCLWFKNFQLQKDQTEIKNLMLLDQKWDISETNHHIAFLKDCNDSRGRQLTGKINKRYIHFYDIVNWFHRRCIWRLSLLEVKDLLITYSRRLHAGCRLIETLQLSASCTLAGSSVFKKSFVFFGNILVSSFPRPHARTMWKPQKTSLSHSYLWRCRHSCEARDRHKLLSFIISQNEKLDFI